MQGCQSINISLLAGTACWLSEPRAGSQRAEECAENAENVAFNKHITSFTVCLRSRLTRTIKLFCFSFLQSTSTSPKDFTAAAQTPDTVSGETHLKRLLSWVSSMECSLGVCVTLGRQVLPRCSWGGAVGVQPELCSPRVAGPERPEPAWLLGEARSRCWTHRRLVACARLRCQPLPGASLALSWLS